MDSTAKIEQDLKRFILDEYLPGEDEEDLTNDIELITTGILDSISVIGLIAHLESLYGITFEAHEASLENMNTIDSMTALVASKQ